LNVNIQGFQRRLKHESSNQRDIHDILLASRPLNKVSFPANDIELSFWFYRSKISDFSQRRVALDAFDAIKELNVLVESGLKNVYLRSNHGKVRERRTESGDS
jgi:hypothetical protein